MKIPGIGPTRAKKIIEYRNNKGGIKSLKELTEINGIGPVFNSSKGHVLMF